MKALRLEGKQSLVLRDIPVPVVKLAQALITVEVAGIGGSEVQALANPGIRTLPISMGHSIVGKKLNGDSVVVFPLHGCQRCDWCKADKQQLCDNWKIIGVHSDGGFQQQLAVPEAACLNLPNSVSWQQATFIEPFANSINAFDRSKANSRDTIAIIGAGSLGLGLVSCALQSHCSNIFISDLSKKRLQAAVQLGAVTQLRHRSETFDIVFDTVGSGKSRNVALELTRKGGKCVFLGFDVVESTINFSNLIRNQQQLLGSFVYSKAQFQRALKLVEKCQNKWVTGVGFNAVEKHLLRFQQGGYDLIKIALRPNL